MTLAQRFQALHAQVRTFYRHDCGDLKQNQSALQRLTLAYNTAFGWYDDYLKTRRARFLACKSESGSAAAQRDAQAADNAFFAANEARLREFLGYEDAAHYYAERVRCANDVYAYNLPLAKTKDEYVFYRLFGAEEH